jgi:hypothetical protein
MRVNHHKWRSGREGERKRGKQKKGRKNKPKTIQPHRNKVHGHARTNLLSTRNKLKPSYVSKKTSNHSSHQTTKAESHITSWFLNPVERAEVSRWAYHARIAPSAYRSNFGIKVTKQQTDMDEMASTAAIAARHACSSLSVNARMGLSRSMREGTLAQAAASHAFCSTSFLPVSSVFCTTPCRFRAARF